MRAVISVSLILLLAVSIAMGGGIVTNTNQSAAFMRTLNRNVSTEVDAVYYNPAGLTRLDEGLQLSLSNQSIFQKKTVINSTANLNSDEFVGKVNAFLFPNFYAVYRMDEFAFFGGFEPIGGGGSAEYEDGLPSFETTFAGYVGVPAAALDAQLAAAGNINGYSLDVYFKGSSVYYGTQLGAAYKINDMFSVAAGFRYVFARNAYEGYLKNNVLLTENNINIDHTMSAALADKEVEATQTGGGVAGIISVFSNPYEGLDVSLRIETATKLELENETTKDDVGLYPDGAKVHADIPAMLALGAAYQITEDIRAEGNANVYMNGSVDWDGKEDATTWGWEIGAAGEYAIDEQILASLGFLYAEPGVYENYHTESSYSLPSFTVGLGAKYKVDEQITANAGLLNTFYMEQEVGVQTYQKTTFGIAVGVDYKF